ncbi:hypothetical protein ROZALSC1DRAFT_25592, partial [Rozella allomycis CSF55]
RDNKGRQLVQASTNAITVNLITPILILSERRQKILRGLTEEYSVDNHPKDNSCSYNLNFNPFDEDSTSKYYANNYLLWNLSHIGLPHYYPCEYVRYNSRVYHYA